jgi:hypothetical protein
MQTDGKGKLSSVRFPLPKHDVFNSSPAINKIKVKEKKTRR